VAHAVQVLIFDRGVAVGEVERLEDAPVGIAAPAVMLAICWASFSSSPAMLIECERERQRVEEAKLTRVDDDPSFDLYKLL